MDALGWFLALLIGLFVGMAWLVLIVEMVGVPLLAALGGVGQVLRGRRRTPR